MGDFSHFQIFGKSLPQLDGIFFMNHSFSPLKFLKAGVKKHPRHMRKVFPNFWGNY